MREASGRTGGEDSVNEDVETIPPSCVADQLRESLAETARLLRAYEQEQGPPSLEMYQKCCRQFVTYLVTNMETSSGFTTQMEKMIDASYRNSSARSLVAQDLWLRCDAQDAQAPGAGLGTPAHQSTRIKTDMDTSVAVTPLVIASASVTGVRPTCSPLVDVTVSTPSTVERAAKRPKRTNSVPSKRPRHAVSRNLYGTGSLTEESETETETETEASQEPERPVVPQRDKGSEGFVWPCSGDGSVKRSDAFKRHLKMALALVDAENCVPPPGMICTHGCDRMRNSMCATHCEQGGKAMPCHDDMCPVWRVVDKHLVRCQDSQCEFKNHVGLRQTQHDIQRNRVKLEETTRQLQGAMATLAQGGAQSSISNAQLESKIERLENKCSKLEDAVGFHKEREHTFLVDLSIGVHQGSDVMDSLPSIEIHYARQ